MDGRVRGASEPPRGLAAGDLVFDESSGLYLPPVVKLASVRRRIAAAVLSLPLVVLTLGVGYVGWGLVVWRRGTTPALQVLGMRCWSIDEARVPGFWRMARREILGRFVDAILVELLSFVLFVAGARRQSLHDLVANTTVLHDPQKALA